MRDHLLKQREALRELASTQRSVLTA
jgi:hypothetical protein